MAKNVTIPLVEPIEGHQGMHKQIVLREPNWDDVMGTGAPFSFVPNAEGKYFIVYDEQAIKHYAEACMVEPSDGLLVSKLGLADTLKVRDAVLRFFRDAEKEADG